MGSAGGLSDALSDLAAGRRQDEDDQRSPGHAESEAEAADPLAAGEAYIVAELDEQPPIAAANRSARPQPQPAARRRTPPKRKPAQDGLKAVAVPILATVGLLLLFPAIWATLLLAGVEVWQSEREDARTMAVAMLACYPVALVMFAGSGLFFVQVQNAKKQAPAKRR